VQQACKAKLSRAARLRELCGKELYVFVLCLWDKGREAQGKG